MAIVQISRIQHRRGRKLTSTGMPQLASGELGWAVDTQELYIGNGAVSEGAPSVGNTKILTEHDNIFDLAEQYAYKPDNSIWGINSPVRRSLQDRLDDFVTASSFGATGNGTDQTSAIQAAVDALFLSGSVINRTVLYFGPGVYVISQPIKIPPYTTIVGAGKEKTIFVVNSGDGFRTVNSNGDVETTSPYDDSFPTQARYIKMSDFTITMNASAVALDIVDCVYSNFNNIRLKGTWTTGGADADLIGIKLSNRNTSAGTVETKYNQFTNIEIDSFHYAVYSDYDIKENLWRDCNLYLNKFGFAFGENSIIGSPGQATGPLFNTIENCTFDMIDDEGILVANGEYNTSKGNKFFGVGNRGGASTVCVTPVITFASITNVSDMDYFERTQDLTPNSLSADGYRKDYIPEVFGRTLYKNGYANEISIGQSLVPIELLKFPVIRSGTIFIDYIYTEEENDIVREGTIELVCNLLPNSTADKQVQIVDTYNFLIRDPLDPSVFSVALQFTANLVDYGGASGVDTVSVEAINSAAVLSDKMTYTIRVKS